MKRIIIMFCIYTFCFSLQSNFAQKINKELATKIDNADSEEFIRAVITMKERFVMSELKNLLELHGKKEAKNRIIKKVRDFALRSQNEILDILKEDKKEGKVKNINSVYTANKIIITAQKSFFQKIKNREDIEAIYFEKPANVACSNTVNVEQLQANLVWNNLGFTGEGIIIGVLDSGINYDHPDLNSNVWNNLGEDVDGDGHTLEWNGSHWVLDTGDIDNADSDGDDKHLADDLIGYDFFDNDSDPRDQSGHGSHVSGIIAGDGTNGTQTGMAPNAKILTCRVIGYQNHCYPTDVIRALEYAVEKGADIINMSFGFRYGLDYTPGSPDDPRAALRQACDISVASGVVICVAAGNEYNTIYTPEPPVPHNIRTPGDVPSVITIGNVNSNDVIFNESSRGPVTWQDVANYYDYPLPTGLTKPNISAPGVNITSTYLFDVYFEDTGTSMAAPAVSGTVALILEVNPNLTPAQILNILEQTVDPVSGSNDTPPNNDYGYGRINAYEAIKYTIANYGGTFNQDVIIPANDTWNIGNVTLNFATGTQLIVHGQIVAHGTTFKPISSSWNGILVDGAPASSFDDCSITGINNSACGLTFDDSYSGSHQVSDSYIEGGIAAIWIKNSSDPVISNSYLKGTGSNSVVLSSNNSNGKINDCKLYASNYQVIRGHYNMNTATPCYGDAWKYNIIDGTNFTTGGSSIYVSGGIPYFNYGYNSILPDSYLYQYSNYSGSAREARYNYWGGGAPVVQGYTVEDPNYLASQHANAGPNWTLSKSNAIDDIIFEDTPPAKAWKNYFDHNFTEAKEIAKEQFENNSKEEISTELLFLWMKSAMREGTLEKEESNLQSINKNTSINETSRYEAVRWLSKLAIREGDFETAENYISSVPSISLMGREIIFDSADEIMENWGDLEKATALLDEVTTKYRDDETERQKEFVLNLYNSKKDSYKGSNKKETSKEETKVSSFALNPAYPNPFNPTTTISYQIPEQGFVTLKVYDMLGREVASLVNNKMEAGKYSVNFDASTLASGVYVYRITVQSFEISKDFFTQSNKMLLLK